MAANKLKLTELSALNEAAECLRTLAHPHRLRMVQMLLQGDFPVGRAGGGLRTAQCHGVGASALDAALWIPDQ
jgi:hypothetical protein